MRLREERGDERGGVGVGVVCEYEMGEKMGEVL